MFRAAANVPHSMNTPPTYQASPSPPRSELFTYTAAARPHCSSNCLRGERCHHSRQTPCHPGGNEILRRFIEPRSVTLYTGIRPGTGITGGSDAADAESDDNTTTRAHSARKEITERDDHEKKRQEGSGNNDQGVVPTSKGTWVPSIDETDDDPQPELL